VGITDGKQPGDSVPFWQRTCAENRTHACERLLGVETTYCGDHSAWACNELGTHYREGKIVARDAERALKFFSTACELRFAAACANLLEPSSVVHADPHELDLRLLLRERGENLLTFSQVELRARACNHDWTFACKALRSLR